MVVRTTAALFWHWSSRFFEMSAAYHCTVTRNELILLKRLLSIYLSPYLDGILKQQLNIYRWTRQWWRVTMTQLFLRNFQTHSYGRFWLSYDLAENILQRIQWHAQLNSSWIFFSHSASSHSCAYFKNIFETYSLAEQRSIHETRDTREFLIQCREEILHIYA